MKKPIQLFKKKIKICRKEGNKIFPFRNGRIEAGAMGKPSPARSREWTIVVGRKNAVGILIHSLGVAGF